jgi:hypothetical protein
MVIVKDKDGRVWRVLDSADSSIARTEMAFWIIFWHHVIALADGCSRPRPILSMRRHDYPLTSEGVPALFPLGMHVQIASGCWFFAGQLLDVDTRKLDIRDT